jgi:hypothetical protein
LQPQNLRTYLVATYSVLSIAREQSIVNPNVKKITKISENKTNTKATPEVNNATQIYTKHIT